MWWCKPAFPQWWCAPADRNCLRTAGAFCRKFHKARVLIVYICRKIFTLAWWFNGDSVKYQGFSHKTQLSSKCRLTRTFEKTVWSILTDGHPGPIICLSWNGSCAIKIKGIPLFILIFLISAVYRENTQGIHKASSASERERFFLKEPCIQHE